PRMLAGEFSRDEIGAFERGLQMAMPGVAAPVEATRVAVLPPGQIELGRAFLEGELDRALELWREMTASSAHFEHLMWPIRIADKSLRSGRVREARAVLELALAWAEEQLAGQRVDEISSSMIHQVSARFYRPAVELSIAVGDLETAFAYAERGRAFTLRRRLGSLGNEVGLGSETDGEPRER
ncbi:MAG: hypothetical protein MI919_33490, partial [Holophagales bacterium]|nr:hypothetical protein [Holophagales bacterium]